VVAGQLSAALALLDIDPIGSAPGLIPTMTDVIAFGREGRPWNMVAPATEYLRTMTASLTALATELIIPTADLVWRLFHLAVFGTVLVALRRLGGELTSLRPLSGSNTGPAYVIKLNKGYQWDLWFEAAGAWTYYGATSIYAESVRALRSAPRALSPDILLIRPKDKALVIECKYSANPDVVGRSGVLQALGYTMELREGLCDYVNALVVAPTGVANKLTRVEHSLGVVGIGSPEDIEGTLRSFLLV
jgi:hypothetical protein